MFQSLVGNLLSHLYHHANENIILKHLFNLHMHHLYFNYHLLAQKSFSLGKILQKLQP